MLEMLRSLLPHRSLLLRRPLFRHLACGTRPVAMATLPEIASQRSGVAPEKAFAVDGVNLYERLGHQAFVHLSTEFYNRVYEDEDEEFRGIFAKFKKENSIRNQYEFMIQRCQGPPLYSQRKGHPALMARHSPFPCTEATAERYMMHMRAALDACPEIDADSKQRLHDYFRHTCYFLAAGQEAMRTRQVQWPQGQQQQQEEEQQRQQQQERPE